MAKCPLRISLVGGGTDLDSFIEKYGKGSVISFPSTLYVYVSIHDNNRNQYILNYSKNEEVNELYNVQNNPARVVLEHFNTGPITISFLSDIISTGSGLGSSSAYMNALTKATTLYKGEHHTEFEICRLALDLERKFNPETGYQDSYGCGIGGFKRIDFVKNRRPSFSFLDGNFLRSNFDMALYYTRKTRDSNQILKSVNIDKCLPLLDMVDDLEQAIEQQDVERFLEIFNEGWKIKKSTSSMIADDEEFQEWDRQFQTQKDVLGIKLCGAGGGGYFLALCKKGCVPKQINGSKAIPIGVNETGVVGQRF